MGPGNWWSRTGSNRRPAACKAAALPTELRPPENPFTQKEKEIGEHQAPLKDYEKTAKERNPFLENYFVR